MMNPMFFHYSFIALLLAFMFIRVKYHRLAIRTMGRAEFKEGSLAKGLRMVLAIPLVGTLVAYMVSPGVLSWSAFPLPEWARWAGLVMALASLPLLWWVHWALGSNFSGLLHVREEHTLVTYGPYRWVRHPMYSVFYLYMLGTLLLTANWLIGGLMLAGLTAVMLTRLQREEAAMIEKFGDNYRQYMRRTGRFLPPLAARQS
jgi:protein-S-isoprenylcysteine O-methyltransferase Ste14